MKIFAWQTTALKNGKPILLHTRTTDDAVEQDLKNRECSSLIAAAKFIGAHSTPIDEHYLLALGAFIAHTHNPAYLNTKIEVGSSDAIPSFPTTNEVGHAPPTGFLCPIWEEFIN